MNEHQQLLESLYEGLAGLKRAMLRSRDQLMGELQLTRSQIEVLALLTEANSQTIGDVAAALAVTHSAGTQTVETLVKRDLVARTADALDRRIVRLSLTDEGRAMAAQLQRHRVERMNRVFGSLTTDELKLMVAAVERLSGQFDDNKETPEVNQ